MGYGLDWTGQTARHDHGAKRMDLVFLFLCFTFVFSIALFLFGGKAEGERDIYLMCF
jgi:hypothetical protein